ncbi:MAG: hypothetical protein QM308_06380 [Bacillota bacterium]|nr:hypothetical protein [Bacillota bacterium]
MSAQQFKQKIMKNLHDLAEPVEQYFIANGLDYEKLNNMSFHWGIDSLEIRTLTGEVVLSVNGWPGRYSFEETPNTRMYLT